MVYFADTNILLRFLIRSDPDYTVIRSAARIIKSRGDEIVTSAQNIAEFWGVLTRPANVTHAITANTSDFSRFPGIIAVTPREITKR